MRRNVSGNKCLFVQDEEAVGRTVSRTSDLHTIGFRMVQVSLVVVVVLVVLVVSGWRLTTAGGDDFGDGGVGGGGEE